MVHFLPGALASALYTLGSSPYNWTTHFTTSNVDNVNFDGASSGDTFQQKYLLNDTWWGGPGSPIFMYAGNEGTIETFLGNAGLMFDWCASFKCLIVAPEHRCYGASVLPYGCGYGESTFGGLLSHEQAMADYALLLDSLKTNLSATASPVVTFGGSYGAMLAYWFRFKYPSATVGAIAASAPVLQTPGLMDPQAYNRVITDDFRAGNPLAPQAIYNVWQVMLRLGATQAGRDAVQASLRLCNRLLSTDDVWNAIYYFSGAVGYMAMADYPYPANFLGPMPASPVAVAAKYFTDPNAPDAVLLQTMADSVGYVFYNYSGQAGPCFNTTSPDPPGIQGNGWGIQCCHEFAQPIGSYGLPSDMFWPAPFSLPGFIAGCQAQFNGTTPRPYWVAQQYGGAETIDGASNVVLSNGSLDPWISGGITANSSAAPTVIVLVIEGAAHHEDLRGADPADPPPLVEARLVERAAVVRWLNEFYERRGQPTRF